MRKFEITRNTGETEITLSLCLDGSGVCDARTGIGFFDHMLALFSKHGCFDLKLTASGDLNVDTHHTVEDTGIALGKAFAGALARKEGIKRYGWAFIPMDEALLRACADISGRPYLVYEVTPPETELRVYLEFWRSFAFNAGITLHLTCLYGENGHHMVEGAFKAAARALREAVSPDGVITGVPSTKGVL